VKTTLRGHPRPVAPAYQPEIAADAIVWASDHPRREFFAGGSTVATILGNRLASRIADRYLARTAVDGQEERDQPIAPNRPDYPSRLCPANTRRTGRSTTRPNDVPHVVADQAPRHRHPSDRLRSVGSAIASTATA
jgi:hypothetical protein